MDLIEKVQDAVVNAGSSYSQDRLSAYEKALKLEKELNNENAVWALEQMIENFKVADEKKLPLCDDTGIPHVLIEIVRKGKFLKDFSMKSILALHKDLINFQEGQWLLREMILNVLSNHKVYTMNPI